LSEENHLREELLFWRCEHHIVAAERDRLRTRIKTLETALIRCAEISGEDGEAVESARTGAMVFPSIEEFAVKAVQQLRNDYEDSPGASVVPAYLLDAETGEVLRSTTDRGDRT